MEQPNKPTSEGTTPTHNPTDLAKKHGSGMDFASPEERITDPLVLFKTNRRAKTTNLLRDVANRLRDGTLNEMTDQDVGEFAGAIYTLLRDLDCHVSITTPQDVIEMAENDEDPALTSDEAKQICEDLQDNDWYGQEIGDTLRELINDAIEAKKGDVK